ncbi:MAG: hypothetical protein PVJ49_04655 [Acidobacteriota bacterium]|jgi:hypothetical protein
MKKILTAIPLIVASIVLAYAAFLFWEQLSKLGGLVVGVVIGGCLAAGLVLLLWRPEKQVARHEANLPSPWERTRWN